MMILILLHCTGIDTIINIFFVVAHQRISFFALLANFKNYITVGNSTGRLSIKTIRIGGTWYLVPGIALPYIFSAESAHKHIKH